MIAQGVNAIEQEKALVHVYVVNKIALRGDRHGGVSMFKWWKLRTERICHVASDASALIAAFGEQAYFVARERAREERQSGKVLDANRAAGHWDRVRREIGNRTGRDQLDTATRYSEREHGGR